MAYRIVVLVASDRPEECVDPDRVGRLAERFGVRELQTITPGGSIAFHVPFEQGGDCYVEVDVGAELVDWHAAKFESELGRPLHPAPNVFVSWTASGETDLDVLHELTGVVTPGDVATAWDDLQGFGVELTP